MQINQWVKLYCLLIIALTIGFAQTDITLRNPLPTDASLNSVCWNGSMFVAVGARGTVLTSIDGTSWVRRNPTTTNDLYSVTSAMGITVAVGAYNTIMTSTDGVAWTAPDHPYLAYFYNIFFHNGFFLVNGCCATNSLLLSRNGISWSDVNLLFSDTISQPNKIATSAITGVDSIWVAIGSNGKIMSSIDGFSYVERASNTTRSLRNVAGNGALALAVGDSGTIVKTSNGVNWIPQQSGVSVTLGQIISWKGLFIATGDSGTIVTSSDGSTWDRCSTATPLKVASIAGSPLCLVAAGNGGTLLRSSDGKNWNEVIPAVTHERLTAVCAGSEIAVAVGEKGTIISSSDGIKWSRQTSGTTQNFSTVTWGKPAGTGDAGRFVVQSYTWPDSVLWLTSGNGVTWETHPSSFRFMISQVIWAGDKFIAVGSYPGLIITSPDGIQWTERFRKPDMDFLTIGYNGTVAVAGGYPDTVVTSTDGITWTKQHSGINPLYSMVWADDQFVATSGSSRIILSANGVEWVARDTLFSYFEQYGPVSFMLAHGGTDSKGYNGYLAALVQGMQYDMPFMHVMVNSADGITWIEQLDIFYSGFNALTYFEKVRRFIGVGDNGAIITAKAEVPVNTVVSEPVRHPGRFRIGQKLSSITVVLPSMPDVGGWKISVYTPAGKKITSSDHISTASFEIGYLSAGTYLVEIRSDHLSYRQRIGVVR